MLTLVYLVCYNTHMEQLFGSKTRVKLLKLFMSSPNRSFYVREITRKIEEQINSVRRELANLLSLGIITSDSTNNKLYYEVNQKYENYEALKLLFTGKKTRAVKSESAVDNSDKKDKKEIAKTVEAVSVDEDIWAKVGNIAGLLYSGAFTRDDSSPVDVLIVGDVTTSRVESAVSELEKEKNRELRYAIMELDEWLYRRQVNDKFFTQIMSAKNQIVKDEHGIFARK